MSVMSCRSGGNSSVTPCTMMSPESPPNTCASEMPCACEWYQKVPAGWSAGSFSEYANSLARLDAEEDVVAVAGR